ncbi:hypothetical protein DRE_06515 [Drechslerella stenobrocha 248]|uniref:Uncharacterized protein n=1 Tax=Drechslerella stenobrocha 248 TaxID=1043628 RepID=W7HX99_9PEZI|nr:hypothetical protein DRE_06515 [Drechslerella stenobrocha 248]
MSSGGRSVLHPFSLLLFVYAASALRIGVEYLDEVTKQPLNVPLWQVCRAPANAPEWGIRIIDPETTKCSDLGERRLFRGMGMQEEFELVPSVNQPDRVESQQYGYYNLVGPHSGTPITNHPSRPINTWFEFGVDAENYFEPSEFTVSRAMPDGTRLPQLINSENPLRPGDVFEWIGPNRDLGTDHQLRRAADDISLPIEFRIARSDEPVDDWLPIRLVVMQEPVTDIVQQQIADGLDPYAPSMGESTFSRLNSKMKEEETLANIANEPEQDQIGRSRLKTMAKNVATSAKDLGKSLWNNLPIVGRKGQAQDEESKEDSRVPSRGIARGPSNTDTSKSRIGGLSRIWRGKQKPEEVIETDQLGDYTPQVRFMDDIEELDDQDLSPRPQLYPSLDSFGEGLPAEPKIKITCTDYFKDPECEEEGNKNQRL